MPKFNIYWMYAILLAFLAGIFYLDDNTMTKPLDTIDQFEEAVKNGYMDKIIVYSNKHEAEGILSQAGAEATFSPEQVKRHTGTASVTVRFGDTQSFEKRSNTGNRRVGSKASSNMKTPATTPISSGPSDRWCSSSPSGSTSCDA